MVCKFMGTEIHEETLQVATVELKNDSSWIQIWTSQNSKIRGKVVVFRNYYFVGAQERPLDLTSPRAEFSWTPYNRSCTVMLYVD